MFRVTCINPEWPSPDGTFSPKAEEYLEPGGRFLSAPEQGADSLIVYCSYCQAENKVWAVGVKKESVWREVK